MERTSHSSTPVKGEASLSSTEKRIYIFEKAPVRRAVLQQMLPTVAGQMVALLYNLADTFFVGLLNAPIQTAAVTVAYPPFLMMTAVSNLFGIGGASAVSHALGRRDMDGARRISAIAFWLSLASAAVFSLLCGSFLHPLLSLCGADAEVYPVAAAYARWTLLWGGAGTILNLLLSNLLRAEGRAALAFAGVTLGGVLNIVLDPFFILPQYMNMGAAGAGLATAISNTAGTLFFLLCLLRRSSTVLSLRPCHLKRTGVYIREILSIGFPSALQYALTVVSLAVLSLFVSKYAVEAVAAYGIVKKLDNLPLYFSLGTSAGLLPFLSYNYASGDRERQRQGFVFGVSITVGFSLACVIVFELFAPQLARLFIQDDMTVAYAAAFLRRMVLCMPFVAICHPMITQFQAMGRTRESLICSILRKGSLDIPLLLLLDRLYPLYGCALVQPVVDLISLIVALVLYRRLRRTSVV